MGMGAWRRCLLGWFGFPLDRFPYDAFIFGSVGELASRISSAWGRGDPDVEGEGAEGEASSRDTCGLSRGLESGEDFLETTLFERCSTYRGESEKT